MDLKNLSEESTQPEIERALYGLAMKAGNEGMKDVSLYEAMGNVPQGKVAEAVNSLLSKGRLKIFQAGENLIYRGVSQATAEKFSNLGPEELLIYQLIEQSGDKGIWIRDLRTRSNLQNTQVTKIIKTLEGRKLIKAVKYVASKNKKVYMLYDIEPSSEVVGTAFHTDQEMDAEFIETLGKASFRFIVNKGCATVKAVSDAVRSSGISHVVLREEDIQQIINMLVYDGKIEEYTDTLTDEVFYKAKPPSSMHNRMTEMPCGVCPVYEHCVDGGVISPQSCVYMTEWLSF